MKKKVIASIIIMAFVPILASAAFIGFYFDAKVADLRVDTNVEKEMKLAETDKKLFMELVQKEFNKSGIQGMNFDMLKNYEKTQLDSHIFFLINDGKELLYMSDKLKEYIDDTEEVESLFESPAMNGYYITYERIRFISDEETLELIVLFDYDKVIEYWNMYDSYYLRSFLAVFALLAVIMILWISRHIRVSLNKITAITKEIEKGNLESDLVYDRKDEFREIAESIDSLKHTLIQNEIDKDKLEKDKKNMLMNITHDIKTPITSIRGYIQAINDGIVKDDQTLNEYLQIISDKAKVIDLMVKDFNEIVKYDYGKMDLKLENIDIRYFIQDCIEEFNYSNLHKELTIGYAQSDLRQMVNIDPKLMERVLSNIIGNSIKYNKKRSLHIDISVGSSAGYYIVRIEDNGIGVSEDNLKDIFQRFFREDKSRNSDIEGSGIGLSICHDIVKAHGGNIKAFNQNNKFVVEIELLKAEV